MLQLSGEDKAGSEGGKHTAHTDADIKALTTVGMTVYIICMDEVCIISMKKETWLLLLSKGIRQMHIHDKQTRKKAASKKRLIL